MQPLNELHSRRLFFKRLFDTEDGCPKQLREISDDMLRKCKGVPLGIISIASLLANQRVDVETWEKIRNSLGFELDMNPTLGWMWHVLSLSYNDLSHELKTCFLYLGMYPEDHTIPKFSLVRKWIAKGFVREKHGLDLEEAAENCFNELNRSMIQPCLNTDTGEVWDCRVHDLMLDLIISKCKEENFVTTIDRKFTMNGALQIRRISHQLNQAMPLVVERMCLSQVRSYNFFSVAYCVHPLSKFQLLRVLDMDQGSLPHEQSTCLELSAVNHLFLLRYLRVWGFRLELPKKFARLKHLMTIEMSWVWLLPTNRLSDLTSLSSLRHLTLPVYGGSVALRNGLSKLCNLGTLFRFDTGTNSVDCIRDLGELTDLRELSIIYSRPRDEDDNLDIVLAASLDKLGKSNLRYLAFRVESGIIPSTQFWSNCFTRPRHLQSLFLHGIIPRVPMALADRLAYLYQLEAQELSKDDIQVLAQLPSLIHLKLRAINFPKNIIIHPNTFPSLKHFDFSCRLSCITFEPAAMPRLQRLKIRIDGSGCRQAATQGSPVGGIEHLVNLEEISIDISPRRYHESKTELACRQAISKHPKSEAIQICIYRF